jgi:hypothetical protein
MPNWVSNSLTIEGNPSDVIKLKNQVSKPYIMPVESNGDLSYKVSEMTINNDFSFWNIIAPTDLDEYVKQPWIGDVENRVANPNSWYNWNIDNWGVKWDTTNPQLEDEVENGDNLVLVYSFETAWGVPNEALIELSRQFPSLLLTNEYQEETGWGGETEYLRGKITAESEYNWMCYECDYKELDEPPYCETCEYDMCPDCGNGEPDEDLRQQCQTHRVELVSTEKAE